LCDDDTFVQEFKKLFHIDLPDTDAANLWNSWVGAPYDNMVETIKNLKTRYKVACLSNTNNLHWQHLNKYLDCEALFSPAYASHHIHQAKPDKACFEFIVNDLKASPGNILFLDDSEVNVAAARNCGLIAYQIDPRLGALPKLKELGIL